MRSLLHAVLFCTFLGLLTGCPMGQAPVDDPTGDTPGDTTGDPTGDDDTTGDGSSTGDVSDEALGFAGRVAGTVATSSSTSAADDTSGRKLAAFAISSGATIWATDLDGNPLVDDTGAPYAAFPLDTDGVFDLTGLPVGVDIVLHFDLDGDGEADLRTIINIPADDAGSDSGTLDDIVADPLSTLTHGRIRKLLQEAGLNPGDSDLSLSALIERIRDAYENLFGDAGVEEEITLEDIAGLTDEELAALFDEIIPEQAQRGMQMAQSNMRLAAAEDTEGVMLAIAEVLVKGGFVIADEPDGVDFSSLASLPNVEAMTMAEFDQMLMAEFGSETQATQLSPTPLVAEEAPPSTFDPADFDLTLYVSMVTEPDRNFAQVDEQQGFMPRPWFGEYIIEQLADMFIAGNTITLGELRTILVDTEFGAGMRLMYGRPGADGMWTEVFHDPNGTGIELDTMNLWQQLDAAAAQITNPEDWDQHEDTVRDIISDFLDGTAEPSLNQLFGPILTDRIPSAQQMARQIRRARAHLPFSTSGPSRWYVVADGDRFMDETTGPVTVDIERGRGKDTITRVTYNAQNQGKYFLTFGPWEEDGSYLVGFMNRRNGKTLHTKNGEPIWADMSDTSVFRDVGSFTFFEKFAETRTEYPTAPVLTVPNDGFDPSLPPDPETNPPDWEMWALVEAVGSDIPVLVDYDPTGGIATYSEAGQYYVVPGENWDQGLFELVDENGNWLLGTPGDWETKIEIDPANIQGITLQKETWTWIYDIDVPNPGYDSDGAPYFDDLNGNGVEDAGEPRFSWQAFLWDPQDWLSTDIETYYRAEGSGAGFFDIQNVDWASETPALVDGTPLVPRQLTARMNAFRFGRPNSAVNLFMAFTPPQFFNGTQAMNANTELNALQAVALIDLVFESIQNVETTIDWDGPEGPGQPVTGLTDAWFFIAPVGDPVQMIADGFEHFAE